MLIFSFYSGVMAESRHSSADGKLKQGQLFLRQQQQRLKEQVGFFSF